MEIGINLYCYDSPSGTSLEKQAELMKENGFTKTFTCSDRPAASRENAELLSRYGIEFDTLHAPFDGINSIWKKNLKGRHMLSRLVDGVDKCTRVGAKVLVVHLSSGIPAPRINDVGFSRFDKLMNYAAKKNVKIAYENQRFVANIAAAMENYEHAGFCWDTGHEACFAFGKKYMPLFGDRLSALHIHDNHKIFNMDEHLIPFDGKIDFDYIAKEIAGRKYTGTLMLELERNNSHYYDKLSASEYYRRAGAAAKKLRTMVENYR